MMTTATLTTIISRPYSGDDDFWKIRNLLIETYPLTPTGFNWEIRRWDGWNTHRANSDRPEKQQMIRLWETADGKLVGVAHPEGSGEIFLELHPDYRELEREIFAWGEAHLSVAAGDGAQCQVETVVFDYDMARRRVVEARGYAQTPDGVVTRRLRLGKRALPTPEMAAGFLLRTTRTDDLEDCQRMAALLNGAFKRTIHSGEEYHNFVTQSPSFRHDLNLVAEAPDGVFAAHVGVTYDDANCRGVFEPVCTHPEHQRKGLARALMLEGLHRIRAFGATDAYVDTGDGMAANWLYEAVGFTEVYHASIWRKV